MSSIVNFCRCAWCNQYFTYTLKYTFINMKAYSIQPYPCCSQTCSEQIEHYLALIYAHHPKLKTQSVFWDSIGHCLQDTESYTIHIAYYPCFKTIRNSATHETIIEPVHLCELAKLGHKYAKLPLKDFMPKEIKVDLPAQRHVMAFQQVDVVEFSIFL